MGASSSLLLLDWQTPWLAAQIDSVSSGGTNRTRKISVVEAQSCAMAETRNDLRKFIDVRLVRKFTASEFMTLPPCAPTAAAGGCLGRRSSEGGFDRQPLESRSNRRLFDIWHIQIILGEELDETGGDGGGIPARQVVARTRYRHRVDFWNPLLQ